MDKEYKIVEIPICGNCHKEISEGAIVCFGCDETNPKIVYEHIVVYKQPNFKFDKDGNLMVTTSDPYKGLNRAS